jgi:hypothetical protein
MAIQLKKLGELYLLQIYMASLQLESFYPHLVEKFYINIVILGRKFLTDLLGCFPAKSDIG